MESTELKAEASTRVRTRVDRRVPMGPGFTAYTTALELDNEGSARWEPVLSPWEGENEELNVIPEAVFTLGVAGGPAALGSFLQLSPSPRCDSAEGLVAHLWPFQAFGSH